MIASGGWNKSRAQTDGYSLLYSAPTFIMMCGWPEQPLLLLTAGIAVGIMIMAVTALESSSITVSSIKHGFGGPDLRKLLGLLEGNQPLLPLVLG